MTIHASYLFFYGIAWCIIIDIRMLFNVLETNPLGLYAVVCWLVQSHKGDFDFVHLFLFV